MDEPIRNHRLIDAKIGKYLLPSVLLTMAMQLGNIVDTILVGNLLGTDAMSAIRIALPVMTIEQVAGYGLGAGGAICAGILLGKRDTKRASAVFSTVFWLTLIYGLVFVLGAFLFSKPLAAALADNGSLAGLSAKYLFVWMLGAPILGTGLFLVNFMGVESRPALSSAYIIVSNAVNLVLDYIFLAFTPLGITGAALSTMIGYLVGMVVFIKYFRQKDKMLKLSKHFDLSALKDAVKSGTPTLIYMGMSFIQSLGSNYIILKMLGVDGMTIYTVCTNVLLITLMVTGGIIGVIPSLAGVLYGEKDFYGLRAVCVRTLKITAAATLLLFLTVVVFTGQIAAIFGIHEHRLAELTVPAMRCFMFCLPFYVWNKFLTSYYQCIEQTKLASLISFLQYGAIMFPAAYIGINASLKLGGSGFNAMGLSFVISEVLTALIALIFRRITQRGNGVFMLPAENTGECLDMTIPADPSQVTDVTRRIRDFAIEKGVDSTLSNRMAVAAEEMMLNAIAHGGKSSEWLDVSLAKEEDRLRLRIRDNGVPFDPADYTFDGDLYDIGGIEIVKRLASKVSYVRAIDLNNTVIEIALENSYET